MDETDTCPSYQMRVAMKPFRLITVENLQCTGLTMPDDKIVVTKDNYANYG